MEKGHFHQTKLPQRTPYFKKRTHEHPQPPHRHALTQRLTGYLEVTEYQVADR